MPCSIRSVTRVFAVSVLLASLASLGPSQDGAAPDPAAPVLAQDPPPQCCFTNPRHTGSCEVEPAKDESCKQILDYLNDPMSSGKGYCGNTTIRGGWQSVACEAKKSAPAPGCA